MPVTISKTISTGGTQYNKSRTQSPDDEVVIRGVFSVANGQTDKELAVGGVSASQLVAVWLASDRDVTLETNDGTTPDDTIALAANVPYLWQPDEPDACLITADIANAIYATNASGADAQIQMMFVQDGTP